MKKKRIILGPEFKEQVKKFFNSPKECRDFITAIKELDFSKGKPIGKDGVHYIDISKKGKERK